MFIISRQDGLLCGCREVPLIGSCSIPINDLDRSILGGHAGKSVGLNEGEEIFP